MKTVLLTTVALALLVSMGSCPLMRASDQASLAQARDSLGASKPDAAAHAASPTHSAKTPTRTLSELREKVREIISPRCGTCHTSTLPTAKPGAIKIFDLARDDWSSMITKDHFKGFERRLHDLNKRDGKMVSELIRTELAIRLQ